MNNPSLTLRECLVCALAFLVGLALYLVATDRREQDGDMYGEVLP